MVRMLRREELIPPKCFTQSGQIVEVEVKEQGAARLVIGQTEFRRMRPGGEYRSAAIDFPPVVPMPELNVLLHDASSAGSEENVAVFYHRGWAA